MNRLIIHPEDRSTDFLKSAYSGVDATVMRGGYTQRHIMDQIEEHDQIVMLGHGTPHGLLSVGKFPGRLHVIDDDFADALAPKDNIFVWCNADQYVDYNYLTGFTTGMFVSETSEAYCMGLGCTTKAEVDESNAAFAKALRATLELDPEDRHASIKANYGALAESNPVAAYNTERLYYVNDHPPQEYDDYLPGQAWQVPLATER